MKTNKNVSLYANAAFDEFRENEDNTQDFQESLTIYEDYLEKLDYNFYEHN